MIKYLGGDRIADHIIKSIKRTYASCDATLAVRGDGPFKRQIERMAEGTCVKVIELESSEVALGEDIDVVHPSSVCDFFTMASGSSWVPCVIDAIHTLIVAEYAPTLDIIVLGRGRFGTFAATFLAREYGRVVWQSASEPIAEPGLIVNCSRETPESYPDGSIVIEINRLGRLTTAILLLRTVICGHGEIGLV